MWLITSAYFSLIQPFNYKWLNVIKMSFWQISTYKMQLSIRFHNKEV